MFRNATMRSGWLHRTVIGCAQQRKEKVVRGTGFFDAAFCLPEKFRYLGPITPRISIGPVQ